MLCHLATNCAKKPFRLGQQLLKSLQFGRRKRLNRRSNESRFSCSPRHVEALEDRTLLTDFTSMIAEVDVRGSDGEQITAFLRGQAEVNVGTAMNGEDDRDFVDTEIVSMDLQGFDSFSGPLSVRVVTGVPTNRSIGRSTERLDLTDGVLDDAVLPDGSADPDNLTNRVDSFFDIFLEIEAVLDDPDNPVTLFGQARIETRSAGAKAAPAGPGDVMRLADEFELFVDVGGGVLQPAGFTVEELDVTFQAAITNLSGQKWNDINGDGVKNPGEPGLDNWIIVAENLDTEELFADITKSVDLNDDGIDPDTESGLFSFDLPPGEYFVTELQQAGWAQTFPLQVPVGDLPQVGPGENWLQTVRQGNDFLSFGVLVSIDWDNDGEVDEVVYEEGGASIFSGAFDAQAGGVQVEIGQFDLLGTSSRGPVHIRMGDNNANLVRESPISLIGDFDLHEGGDTTLAEGFFDIFLEFDVGVPFSQINSQQGPPADKIWRNAGDDPIQVEAIVDRLSPTGVPFLMTNVNPVPLFDDQNVQQAQIIDMQFAPFRENVFDQTVGYYYQVGQGQNIDGVLFGNIDQGNGPFGVDFGDAPVPYPTDKVSNGASHLIDGRHFLGRGVDAEPDGQPDPLALGDDNNIPTFAADFDDEDGVLFLEPLVAGQTATAIVVGSNFATDTMLLSAWIDFNDNGRWNDAGEKIFADQPLNPGQNQLQFNVSALATEGLHAARFRVSTQSGLSFVGAAENGEVEDYMVVIHAAPPIRTDWGDAPDPVDSGPSIGYPTLNEGGNGAVHATDGITVIGNYVDGEIEGQPNATATGDDLAGAVDDEDGIRLLQPLLIGRGSTFEVSTLNGGFLNVWVDFNRDGDWTDAGEWVTSQFVNAGRNNIFTQVPVNGSSVGDTFARFRLSPTAGEVGAPHGPALNPNNPLDLGFGEVEDMLVTIRADDVETEDGDLILVAQPQGLPAFPQSEAERVGISVQFDNGAEDDDDYPALIGNSWLWFSVGEAAPQPIDSLTLVSTTGGDSSPLILTYGNINNADPISVVVTLSVEDTGGVAPDNSLWDATGTVTTSVSVTNLTDSDVGVDVFKFTDITHNGPFGQRDVATVISSSSITITGVIGSSITETITGELPDHYQVGTVATDGTAFPFQNNAFADLTDSPVVSTTTARADVAHAFQWTRTLAADASFAFESANAIQWDDFILPEQTQGGAVSTGGNNASNNNQVGGGGDIGFSGSSAPTIDRPRPYDPAFAIGYDFVATVNLFRSVKLPSGVGDDQYQVTYDDDSNTTRVVDLAAGTTFDFQVDGINVATGVTDFRVTGIESSAQIDVADQTGFVSLLSFVTGGPFNITQTGIPEFVYVSEDGRLREDVDVGGQINVLQVGDVGTWMPGTALEVTGLTFGRTLFDSLAAANAYVATNNFTGLTEVQTTPAGITIAQSDGVTTVSESGATDKFTVVLDTAPTDPVTVTVVSSDTNEVTVSTASLTFTNGNWNVPQTVTVTGVPDNNVADGDTTTTVTVSVDDGSSDGAYADVVDRTVSVTNQSHTNRSHFVLKATGRATDFVDIVSTTDNDNLDVELRASGGAVLSPGFAVNTATHQTRVSLAGYPAGTYELWLNDAPANVTVAPNDSLGNATTDPAISAIDLDANGTFEFSNDGILILAWSLGISGADLEPFRGGTDRNGTDIETILEQLADSLDLDGDGQFSFATDGIVLLANSLGSSGSGLEAFRSNGATRNGPGIEARIAGLKHTVGSTRVQTSDSESSGHVQSFEYATSNPTEDFTAVFVLTPGPLDMVQDIDDDAITFDVAVDFDAILFESNTTNASDSEDAPEVNDEALPPELDGLDEFYSAADDLEVLLIDSP